MAKIYSTREAAEYLGIAPSRVRALIAEGRIKAFKLGGLGWAVYESDLDRFASKPRKVGRPQSRK